MFIVRVDTLSCMHDHRYQIFPLRSPNGLMVHYAIALAVTRGSHCRHNRSYWNTYLLIWFMHYNRYSFTWKGGGGGLCCRVITVDTHMCWLNTASHLNSPMLMFLFGFTFWIRQSNQVSGMSWSNFSLLFHHKDFWYVRIIHFIFPMYIIKNDEIVMSASILTENNNPYHSAKCYPDSVATCFYVGYMYLAIVGAVSINKYCK